MKTPIQEARVRTVQQTFDQFSALAQRHVWRCGALGGESS